MSSPAGSGLSPSGDVLFTITLKSCLFMHKLGMFITLNIYSKY
ncbi:uncharacterized protein METZ01_LOCUS40317 [marine metagenome]|uniref:Uncharacterized protein n=1 Tax=marine metagenome TaxID=408172 RepID=A0A381RDY4_9ZZZZ